MNRKHDLLVITASNGENLNLGKRFVQAAAELKLQAELLDLTKLPLPLFNPRTQKNEECSALVKSLSTKMHEIPKWIICAPEYNGSIPPVLTSAIAWLSVQETDFRSLFNGRPIALATFSGGVGIELLIGLRIQLTHLGAQVVGKQLTSNNQNPAKKESIDDLLKRLMQMKRLKV